MLAQIFKSLEQKYPCCHLAALAVHDLPEREEKFFRDFMPEAVSAVVVYHHIVDIKTWTWYQTLDGSERCDANDHASEVCGQIKDQLHTQGLQCKVVPYPDISGLQFRYVAQATGLGQIGNSAFLLHPEWGPWVHLRVLATTAPTEKISSSTKDSKNTCTNCNKCIENCPAGAFADGFDGLVCRKFRRQRGEHIPVGTERIYQWCLTCALVCPIGEKPSDSTKT